MVLEQFEHTLQIPIRSSLDFVEIYSDEVPYDVNDLMDVLKAEFAPLRIWRLAAMEYYRHGAKTDFFKVLNEIIDAMKVSDVEQFYEDKDDYHDGLVEIYNALACYSLQHSHDDESSISIDDVMSYVNRANSVASRNDFALVLSGFVEITKGNYDLADQRFKSAMPRVAHSADKYLIYGALIGMGSSAYAKNQFNKSLEYFVKALSNYPQCGSSIRVAIAMCCFQLEQFDRARAATKRALHINADNVEALILMGMLDLADASKKKQSSKMLRQVSYEYFLLVHNIDSRCCSNLNQLAHHSFYTWKLLDATASVIGTRQLLVSSDATISLQDMIRIDKHLVAVIESVCHDESGVMITLSSSIVSNAIGHNVVVEYKQLAKVKTLAGNALQTAHDNGTKGESCFILGRMYHVLEEYDYALHFYEQSRQFSPSLLLSTMYMGQILIARHDFTKAKDLFVELSQNAPEDRDAQAYLILSTSLADAVSYPIEKLKDVSSGFCFDIDLWLLQGRIKQQSKCDLSGALKCYDVAIDLMRERSISLPTEVLSNVSSLHHHLGHLDQARNFAIETLEIEKALMSKTCNRTFRYVQQFVCADNNVFSTWSDVVCTVEVLTASSCGLQTTLQLPDGVIISDLYFGEIICVGDVLMQVQLVRGSGQFCATSLLQMPAGIFPLKRRVLHCGMFDEMPSHCFNYARILEDMGRDDAAEEVFLELAKRFPSFLDCYIHLSRLSMRENKLDRASMWLSRAASIDADSCVVQKLSCDIFCAMERCEQAKRTLDKILRKDKNDYFALLSLGNMHYNAVSSDAESSVDLCAKYWHRVLDDNRNNYAAVNNIGIICGETFQMDAARDVFFKVKESVPVECIELGINLANVYLIQEKYLDACRTYHSTLSAILTFPQLSGLDRMTLYFAICDSLAFSCFKSQQFDDCLRVLTKALHTDPCRMSAWYNIAYAHEEFALISLRKRDKTSRDITGAINGLGHARHFFGFLKNNPSTPSIDQKRAAQHDSFCKDALLRADIHLRKACDEESKTACTQRQHDEDHQTRIQEKAKRKRDEQYLQEASRLKLLEKAQEKAAKLENLQQNWFNQTSNDDKPAPKKKKKVLVAENVENSNSSGPDDAGTENESARSIFDSDSESDMVNASVQNHVDIARIPSLGQQYPNNQEAYRADHGNTQNFRLIFDEDDD